MDVTIEQRNRIFIDGVMAGVVFTDNGPTDVCWNLQFDPNRQGLGGRVGDHGSEAKTNAAVIDDVRFALRTGYSAY